MYMKGVTMATATVTIRMDAQVKHQAEELFERLGLNMTTAINAFARQAIRKQAIPFELSAQELPPQTNATNAKKTVPKPGGWEGRIRVAPDFDAPLEDFKDYM
jgi:DNA-damage-inducible protein J